MKFISKYVYGDVVVSDDNVYVIDFVVVLLSYDTYRILYHIKDFGYVTEAFLEQSKIYANTVSVDLSLYKMSAAKFANLEFAANSYLDYALDANNTYIVFVVHNQVGIAVEYRNLEFVDVNTQQ